MRKRITLSLLGWMLLINPIGCFAQVVNPHQVYTYEQMEEDLQLLKQIYPNELSIKTIGQSHFGREIWVVKLGKGEKNILLIGSHHGREWLTSTLLMAMLEQYVHSYRESSEYGPFSIKVLDNVSIWFVPMLNPDGVTIQQSGLAAAPVGMEDELFEMNGYSLDFSKWKANGVGIDLNRQYPAGWNKLNKIPIPWYQFNKGEKPIQANEVKALTTFTEQLKPSIAISYHTSGREIFWKYKNGVHKKRDKLLAKKVSLLTGYSLSTPLKNAVGGGFTDWFITTYHQPGMTIEISPLVEETNPPVSVFSEEWKRNELVGILLAAEAQKMEITPVNNH